MVAYAIYNTIEVLNPAGMEEYRSKVHSIMEKHRGRVLASDALGPPLDGEWTGVRVTIIEFPDMEAINRFHKSDEYKPLLELRLRSARGGLVAVKGA